MKSRAYPTRAPAPSPSRGILGHPEPNIGIQGRARVCSRSRSKRSPPLAGTPEPDTPVKDQDSMPPERRELLQTDSPQTDGGSGPGGPTKPTHPQKPPLQRLSVASDSHEPPLLFKKKRGGKKKKKKKTCSLKGSNLNLSEQSICNSPTS